MRFDGDSAGRETLASDNFPPEKFDVLAQLSGRNRQEASQPMASFIKLASREQRPPQQPHLFQQASHPPMQGDWASNFSTDHSEDALLHRFDTDMSSSDQQTTGSNQPTPNLSHHSSSNTSYSSPHLADDANPNAQLSATTDSNPAFFGAEHSFAGFTPPEDQSQYPLPGPAKIDADFEAWRAGPPGGTPSAGTGLSPMGEGEWTQIMEGMGWDGAVLGQGSRPRTE